jgi:hypothetical protein
VLCGSYNRISFRQASRWIEHFKSASSRITILKFRTKIKFTRISGISARRHFKTVKPSEGNDPETV